MKANHLPRFSCAVMFVSRVGAKQNSVTDGLRCGRDVRMAKVSLGIRTKNRPEGSEMTLKNSQRQLRRWGAELGTMLAAVLLTIFATAAMAQVPTGSVTGTVQDSQGLPVEGVTVTLTNQETNATFTSMTASSGGYQFEHIDYGKYRVTATKASFK